MARLAFAAAFALVRRAYAGAPLPVRLHAIGRFLTCPFLRVLPHLPAGAQVLDLGAGHGTFALLAAEAGASSVVAAEPDARKLLATYRDPRVRFVAGYSDAVGGMFEAVTIFDVLYRIPLDAWDGLLRQAHDRLVPGGVLLIKEIDPGHRLKGLWNRAQEKVADLLGMTLGEAFSYETRDRMRERLTRLGFERFEAIDLGAGYPHAHILYIAYAPASGEKSDSTGSPSL
ncbi:MAG TPA: class I SAM-dependent methyltransferase [Thermoanaerobaculia bacterium]|jgi:SAM-dependent methyltransferase|nr:class I SAM-dependent methyltransferase [Thermoanaerobaculia bacterium]